jgi:hypothetical protein
MRLSQSMQQLIQQAQGEQGSQSGAVRALVLIGAAHAGLDLRGMAREIVTTADETLEPAVLAALRAILPAVYDEAYDASCDETSYPTYDEAYDSDPATASGEPGTTADAGSGLAADEPAPEHSSDDDDDDEGDDDIDLFSFGIDV